MADVFANIMARQLGSTPRLSLRRPARFEAAPAPTRSSLHIPESPSPSREHEQDTEAEAESGAIQPQLRRSGTALEGPVAGRSASPGDQQILQPEPTLGITASAVAAPLGVRNPSVQQQTIAEADRLPDAGPVAPAEPERSGLSVRPTHVREPAMNPPAYVASDLPDSAAPGMTPPQNDRATPQQFSPRQLSAQELLQRHFAPALVAAGHLSQAEARRLVPVPADQPLPRARPGQLPVRLDPVDLPEQTGRRGDVHVHIDHVEITRPAAPAQATPHPTPTQTTKVDHTAYLKRQARRTQR